jgi:O-succinylbenzoic acid--CoA ligase
MEQRAKLHQAFRLNGKAYAYEDLKELGYSLVKEGASHEKDIGDFLLDWLSDSPTVEVYTSGSTGAPGRHLIKKQQMIQSALATAAFFCLQPGNTALLCLPAKYIGGKMMLVRAMVLGLSLDYVKPSATPLKKKEASYDFCAMVPKQFLGSLEDIIKVKRLIIGGAPLGKKGVEAAQPLDTEVFETFGMTETISHFALRRINPPEPVFRTLAGIKAGLDERGCLIVYAPAIAATPLHTNDMARLVSDTAFEWLGRYDNIINSGGIKLVPEQIEQKLQEVINSRFFVTGLPDESLGEQLVVVVEDDPAPADLLQKLSRMHALSAYEIPKRILSIPEFVTTGSGKVNRSATLRKIGYANP